MWIEVDIIGTGTLRDPYRPDVPDGVPFSAPSWPKNPANGRPLMKTAFVCVPDDAAISAKQIIRADLLLELPKRGAIDLKNITHVEKSWQRS